MASTTLISSLVCTGLLLILSLQQKSVLAEEYIQMTLYVEDGNMTGPNPTSVIPVSTPGPTWFGSINIRDRRMADGPGPYANTLGRVLDACFKVAAGTENTWYTYMTLLFKQGGRFNGSTLQVGGLNTPGDAEWAILGGTGNLTMARGIVRRKLVGNNHAQYNVYAYYTPMPFIVASGHELVPHM